MNTKHLCHAGASLLLTLGLGVQAFRLGLRWEHVHGASCVVLAAWFLMGLYWSHQGRLSLLHTAPTLAFCAVIAGFRHAPQVRTATDVDWVGSPLAMICWAAGWVALGYTVHRVLGLIRSRSRARSRSAAPEALATPGR